MQPVQPLRQGVYPGLSWRPIADLAKKYDAYVITDEVYEHIVYAPHTHTYFASAARYVGADDLLLVAVQNLLHHRLAAGLHHRARAEITDRIKKVHDFLTVGAAAPLQEAVIPGLRFGREYYDELLAKPTPTSGICLCKGLDAHRAWSTPRTARRVLRADGHFPTTATRATWKFCEDAGRGMWA